MSSRVISTATPHLASRLLRQSTCGRLSRRIGLPALHSPTQSSRWACSGSSAKPGCQKHSPPPPPKTLSTAFWSSRPVWRRAMVNTLRCLVGCTLGDFSAMWYLQAAHPDLGTGAIMAISMASGVTTSLLLETTLLRYGRDRLSWPAAAQTAAGMSLISMLTMEAAQNAVDYHLTGGVVQLDSPLFWSAALVSMAAGLAAPLPYNYHRLKKYGKACH